MKLILNVVLAFAICIVGRASLLRVGGRQDTRVIASTSLRARVGYMVQHLLHSKDITTRHIANKVHNKMKLSDALLLLKSKLPQDVASLLRLADGEHAAGAFSEVSLAKGRVYLNNMMYDAWLQLDQIEV